MSIRPAPYPPDTRAKGWRFELDYEQIEQSDTWDIAGEIPMAQHALLMMWLVAWRQEPCGSFPSDEAVIRAKCKLPLKMWAQCREILLRGWWFADDGRLYHDTIAARVLEMLEYRAKNAKRVADFKAKQREQREGNALPTRESQSNNDTGTGTGTSSSSEPSVLKKGSRKRAPPAVVVPVAELVAEGFDPAVAAEFIAHKAAVKAPLTARAWADHLAESRKAGWTPQQAAEKVMAKAWKGFEAKYVAGQQSGAVQALTFRQRDELHAIERVREMTGGLAAAKPTTARTEAAPLEVFDATRRLG